MPEAAFLVEGLMEKKIIQSICPGKTVRLIGCNGDDIDMGVIARFIDVQMRSLKNFFPIIIVLDRERRVVSRTTLIEELSDHLNDRGHSGQFIIGMPDRTIENWILADWGNLRRKFPEYGACKRYVEGSHGKSSLRKLLPRDVIYHEPTIGKDLFVAVNARNACTVSQSLREFVESVTIDCTWLVRR